MTGILTIAAGDATGATGRRVVSVTLTDSDGRQVTGYSTAGELVDRVDALTSDTGALSLSLIPNADITPASTYYTLTIGGRSMLIEKSSATQTVLEALATDPAALTASVIDGGYA